MRSTLCQLDSGALPNRACTHLSVSSGLLLWQPVSSTHCNFCGAALLTKLRQAMTREETAPRVVHHSVAEPRNAAPPSKHACKHPQPRLPT